MSTRNPSRPGMESDAVTAQRAERALERTLTGTRLIALAHQQE